MTNTRVSDLEILEKRLPVLVRKFGLRPNSGGNGLHHGGDGATRVIEARTKMTFTLNTDRRTRAPFGLAGGHPAKAGLNLALLDHPSGRKNLVNVGGKGVLRLKQGEQLHINTPGGGGWGTPVDEEKPTNGISRINGSS